MVDLVKSTRNTDICHQALRCLNAMIAIVVSESNPGQKPKNITHFSNAIDALSVVLRNPNSMIRREATVSVSLIALMHEQLRDTIVNGIKINIFFNENTSQTVIYLLL